MTENLKKFLAAASQNAELAAKIDVADQDTLIAIAKEQGYDLTKADFVQHATELDDDELDAIAGGDKCYCAVGGGGTGNDENKTCACVVAGFGFSNSGWDRCSCGIGGYGEDEYTNNRSLK